MTSIGYMASAEDATPDDFDVRLFEATGMMLDDAVRLGEAQAALEAERIRSAGYCCEAGVVAHPDPCPWHGC